MGCEGLRATSWTSGLGLCLLLSASPGWTAEPCEVSADPAKTTDAQNPQKDAATPCETKPEQLTVRALRSAPLSPSATRLHLSVLETPQAVSVLDRNWLSRFGLRDANRNLQLATGVQVEDLEPDRSAYFARGFDIRGMQIDGIGMPFTWDVLDAVDTVIYERVEVVRGANGLLSGTGNPSGTLNFLRKRPQGTAESRLRASTGTHQNGRVEADLSLPLGRSDWASRSILASQRSESGLDRYLSQRDLAYVIADGPLGRRVLLTLGGFAQQHRAEGQLWGALPLLDSEGRQRHLPRSASTSQDWNYWDTETHTGFVEMLSLLAQDWELKTTLTQNDWAEQSELFYVYGRADRRTGLGLRGRPGKFDQRSRRQLLASTLNGPFSLAGRQHELALGLDLSVANNRHFRFDAPPDDPAWGPVPAFPGWHGREFSRPAFGPAVDIGDWQDRLSRLFLVARFSLNDRLSAILGGNAVRVKSQGINLDQPLSYGERRLSPYAGLSLQLGEDTQLYASSSEIFEPQSQVNARLEPIGAARGLSHEAGLKRQLLKQKLLVSAVVFRSEQRNIAENAGYDPDFGIATHRANDLISTGWELEASGQLTDNLHLLGSFNSLSVENSAGQRARSFLPRESFKLAMRYRPAPLEALELSAALRWQQAIHHRNADGYLAQDAYHLLSLGARYDLNDTLSLSLDLENLGDVTYLTSLYREQAMYGAPRSLLLSLEGSF